MKNNNAKKSTKKTNSQKPVTTNIVDNKGLSAPMKTVTVKAISTKDDKTLVKSTFKGERIQLEKYVDSQGVSIALKDDPITSNMTSRYGTTPSIFYAPLTNFDKTVDEISVVKSHDPQYLVKRANNAHITAKTLASEAVAQFEHDIQRAKIVTYKNLQIARVEALRLVTKAFILEKNHHEQVFETKCHEESLKNIALLKEAHTLLNDSELVELLSILKHDCELELKNNEIDLKRAQIKIEELQAIYNIKRKLIREQIKSLHNGQTFNWWTKFFGRVTPRKLIKEIKNKKDIPHIIETETEFDNIGELLSLVKTVDVKKLPSGQAKVWNRFVELVNFLESEDKYADKFVEVQIQLDNLAQEVREIKQNCIESVKKVVMLDAQDTKAIVSAKKESLIISVPAAMYAINVKHGSKKKTIGKNIKVKTKTIVADLPTPIDPSIVRRPVSKLNSLKDPKPTQDDDFVSSSNISSSDSYTAQSSNSYAAPSNLSSNAPYAAPGSFAAKKEPYYQSTKLEYMTPESHSNTSKSNSIALSTKSINKQMVKFQKISGVEFSKLKHLPIESIEYVNYKWEWRTKANEQRKSAIDTYYANIEYHDLDGESTGKSNALDVSGYAGKSQWTQAAHNQSNSVDYKHLFKDKNARNIARLKELLSKLPTDPIVVGNEDTFKQENIHLETLIKNFKSLSDKEIIENPEHEKLISDVEQIFEIYNELVKKDIKYRKGLLKAQLFDKELAILIKKQDEKLNAKSKDAITRFQQIKAAIEKRYQLDLTNAKNQYLVQKELIIDQEQASYAKEEQTYLWNSFSYYKHSNTLLNKEFKSENAIISGVIDRITAFNAKSSNPISLNNIPSKILPLPMHSNARIDISFDQIGSNKYIVAQNTDHENKLLTKIQTAVKSDEIQKIYVLDKFRAVNDIKTRVALLNEYAKQQFTKAFDANKIREAKEIKEANAKLQVNLKRIDKVNNDIETMIKANNIISPVCSEAAEIHKKYVLTKKDLWKKRDKILVANDNLYIEDAKKNQELKRIELSQLKAYRSAERASSLEKTQTPVKTPVYAHVNEVPVKKVSEPSKKRQTEDDDRLFPTKTTSKAVAKAKTKDTNNVPTKKIGFNMFKRTKKEEVSIDEIIGKK